MKKLIFLLLAVMMLTACGQDKENNQGAVYVNITAEEAKQIMETQKKLTLEGNIVISVGLFGHSGDSEVWEGMSEDTLTKTKIMLDDMHKRKIDMADEIFVINVGSYIGSSTQSEIEYAHSTGKVVRYLEEEKTHEE